MKAITSNYEYADHKLPLWKAKYALLKLLLNAGSYEEDRYGLLEPHCSTNETVKECRKGEWVEFYIQALLAGVDLDTALDVRSCESLVVDQMVIV